MKSLIISLIILSSILTAVIAVAICSDKALTRLADTIDAPGQNDKIANAYEIEKEYKDLERFLIFFAHDSEIREMQMYIEDIKSAAQENDQVALITAKSRLRLHIEQLRRLSAFSFEAIF